MNINMLMQQAQRMQKDMESNLKKAKEDRNVVKRIEISPDLLQDEADMIEDLIAAAMNDAARQVEIISEEKLQGANSGMGLPPGLSGLF